MNASEKATSLEVASKIATVVNLFQREFPGVKANLHPWANDRETLEQTDPDSIDLGFNFPPGKTLVQLRFAGDRLIGIDAVCFGLFNNQRWKFSTIANWEFMGSTPPLKGFCDKFRRVCRQMFEVFNGSAELAS
ncbi:MAG: hypothetical protein AB4040_06605 [Synechococcus sp.]